ncbi:MAG TPA: MBL fold metallo-hydrolase [Candidatus Thermoplasmatota archaeon]|nr:MBL fold metallo-hydrolase [Candidatus Thermoplasmatota archaeon]
MTERRWPRSFHDRLTHKLHTAPDIIRIMLSGGFHTWGQDPAWAGEVPRGDGNLPTLRKGQAAATWVGHATYLLQMAGRLIATDPVWNPRLPGRVRRLTEPGVPLESVPRLDAVVISHNHYDHMDAWTLKRLPKDTPLFVPAGIKKWMRRRGLTNVIELDWWETADLDGVKYTFVPSHHWSRRTPWDANKTLWGGWVIEGGGKRVHFAGDTAYGRWFGEIGRRFPNLDISMMPIGAYDPRWFMSCVHVNPEEAVQAVLELGARRMATMHWGTYILTREPVGEPLARVRKAWAATGRPREDLWDLALGESRVF